MILEGLAALFGLALLSGSDKEEKKKKLIKKEKKEIAQKMIGLLKIALEEKMEKRGEYFEKNLKEQYNNIKIKIDNLLKEKEKYKGLKFYINNFKYKKYISKFEKLKDDFKVFNEYFDIIEDYQEYVEKLNNLFLSEEELKILNQEYVEKELNKNKEFFSNIDEKSLDEQQRKAIVIDEDNNLIVAGAGSGKTLTISGKVKYLVEKRI